MIMDKQTQLGSEQAVTTSAGTTDYYDQLNAGDLGQSGKQLQLMVLVTEAVTAAGAATVQIALQCDDNTSFSSAKTKIETPAIPKADLIVGHKIFLPIPVGLDERYIRAFFTVATGPLTAGKFTTAIVDGVDTAKLYPGV